MLTAALRQRLLATTASTPLALLRVVLGIVMFAHGAQKMLGWFGGHGVGWTLEAWEKWFGLPAFITMLVILGEFFGSIALVLGLATRIAAGIIGLIMLGALYYVHAKHGFYMNWYGQPGVGEGFEYHLLVLAMVGALMIGGGGRWALDGRLAKV